MDGTEIAGIFGGLALLAGAIAAAAKVVIDAQAAKIAVQIGVIAAKADTIIKLNEGQTPVLAETLAVVKITEAQGNSAATKSELSIAAGLERERALERHLALVSAILEKNERRDELLAIATAMHPTGTTVVNGSVSAAPENRATESLQQIDENTAATAKNTARTDQAVQKLKDQ